MRVTVQFGDDSAEFDIADDRWVAVHGAPPTERVQNVAAAVADAIESPIDFPPLRQAVVPGDHVAIVLDDSVPRAADVLGPIVECLRGAEVQPHDIHVVAVPSLSGEPNRVTPDALPHGIQLVLHDPHDRGRLSYLAATKDGLRVYLNRNVVDAELVILAGRVDFDPILNFAGTSSGFYPGLVDADARRAFRSLIHQPITRDIQQAARRQADEIAWLLGVQFAIQLVAGSREEAIAVLAGECAAVQREGQRRLQDAWRRRAARRPELVIAAISGSSRSQSFDDLGRVLELASGLVREGGRVAVLSAIGAEPGPALKSARQLQAPAKVLEHLRKSPGDDVISTRQIARACQLARVYLLSRLDNGLVEDLGATPLASPAEAQRLADQVESCLVLGDAQLARVSVEGDDDDFH